MPKGKGKGAPKRGFPKTFRFRNKHEKALRACFKSSERASAIDDGTESPLPSSPSSSSSSSSPVPGPSRPRRAKRPRCDVLPQSSGSEQSVNDESHDLADAMMTQASIASEVITNY